MKKIMLILPFLWMGYIHGAYAQNKEVFDLSRMLNESKLIIYPGKEATVFKDADKEGITCNGIVWLKEVDFEEGAIELDIRGRNEFLKSFVGIAFHGTDTLNYESVYFRPFNFRSPDPVRRTWSVQYMSMPDYPYDRLRKEQEGRFENEIKPNPKPEDWIHARVVIKQDSTWVYVNRLARPSLSVKNINKRKNGIIGLWTSGLKGDFANLQITSNHKKSK